MQALDEIMVNLYEIGTIGVAIAGTIIIPIILAIRPQDITAKLKAKKAYE